MKQLHNPGLIGSQESGKSTSQRLRRMALASFLSVGILTGCSVITETIEEQRSPVVDIGDEDNVVVVVSDGDTLRNIAINYLKDVYGLDEEETVDAREVDRLLYGDNGLIDQMRMQGTDQAHQLQPRTRLELPAPDELLE